MSKTIIRVYVFASGSNPSTTYQTLEYSDGSTSCECKGWTFRRKNTPDGARSCKHTRYIDTGTAQAHAISVKDYNDKQSRVEFTKSTSNPKMPILAERVSRAFDLEEA